MFNAQNRSQLLERARTTSYDLVVIGGGVTGAGILLEAQSRGLNCLLIEMQDFGEGTSSRSTRLIHGGLRYLKQFNFSLVRETGLERKVIHHIARHLTQPKKVLVPSVKGGTFSMWQLRIAMWLYEWLAAVPTHLKHVVYAAEELKKYQFREEKELQGGVIYYEFGTNDARLTLENIKTAVDLGADAISRVKVEVIQGQPANGVRVKDLMTGESFEIATSHVINAAGIWSGEFVDSRFKTGNALIRPSKGVHLVFPKSKVPLTETVYFDTHDGRMMFAIPHDQVVYVGTTDTGDADFISPKVTDDDIAYILEAFNGMFGGTPLESSDIVASWAGLRPLINEQGKATYLISRKHEIYVNKNGVVSITGGKLTGYRQMAKAAVNKLRLGRGTLKSSYSHQLRLCGSDFEGQGDYHSQKADFIERMSGEGWENKNASWLFDLFGSNATEAIKCDGISGVPDYLAFAFHYSVANEMVVTIDDFLVRRTNLSYFYPEVASRYRDQLKAALTRIKK